jgi:hypothetical protein
MTSLRDQTETVDELGQSTKEAYKGQAQGGVAYKRDLGTALGFIGGTAALAGDREVLINPAFFRFPDLIHEVFHTYSTKSSADKPFNEGCTEMFASMVSERIRARSGNLEYIYAFNADYAP